MFSIKTNFKIKNGIWKNQYLWDLYKKGETPLYWQKSLFKFANVNKIKLFSSPFDEECVDILEECNCPIYKIASPEITDHNLIKQCARTGKPVILSTGLASIDDLDEAEKLAKRGW